MADGAHAADSQAGAGEGLTVDHIIRQAQGLAHYPDFVLIQELHGLHQFKIQILRQAAHVMVALHRAGFQDIGINGALGQETDAVQLPGFLGEYVDELLADDLPLLLGIRDAGQLIQEAIHRVHIDEVRAQLLPEDLDDLLRLALPQEAMVHMHAGELTAHRLDEQGGHHGGVHAAGQGQQDLIAADLFPQRLQLLGDERLRQGRGGDSLHGFRTLVFVHWLNLHQSARAYTLQIILDSNIVCIAVQFLYSEKNDEISVS